MLIDMSVNYESRQSAVGSQQSAVSSQQSAVSNCNSHSPFFRYFTISLFRHFLQQPQHFLPFPRRHRDFQIIG
jgi:hypothetical protein